MSTPSRRVMLAVAKAAMQAGVTRIGVVSAAGASSSAPVFYNRVKGELEDALRSLASHALLIEAALPAGGAATSIRCCAGIHVQDADWMGCG